MLAVTILGNNSAIPAFERHPTSQVVQTSDHGFLIDCGEGTQMQMMKYKIRNSKISHIFISHLHGDHYFGLIGLLTSMGLLGRKTHLHLYAPAPLQSIIELQLKVADAHLPYELHFHTLEREELLLDEKTVTVECFKVYHRIPCWGFLFREKKNLRKIEAERVKEYNVPVSFYEELHKGKDYISGDAKVILNTLLTSEGPHAKSYAYCADTLYNEEIAGRVKGVDLLYHEATYLDNLRERAVSRYHSTCREAAEIARKAGVKKLLLGHFSSKYEQLDEFLAEACPIFENTELAVEGATFVV
jgi:ribonuclease Z